MPYRVLVPWVRAILRGQRVLARAREDGRFASEGGRVEVRYKPNDGRAYHAAERNLERVADEPVLPDDACVPVDPDRAPSSRMNAAEKSSEKRKAAASSPTIVPKGAWIVYADGACSGNPGPAGLGIVLVDPAGVIVDGFEYLGIGTNNVAELTGILRAAEIVPNGALAVVHTDSQYSIGVLTKGWKAKANVELIAKVKSALSRRKGWQLAYVPGHAGVPLNERADELAREAVRTRTSRLPARPGS